MATPIPDIRIDWRADGFSLINNDGFETSTAGWSVSAGINAAGTSITRTVTTAYMGTAVGRLVTTGTNGSGVNYDFGTTSFTSGRTYRFRVALKSISGTTAAKILIGSLGTAGDRASATMTLTTSFVEYTVDWTPSGTRTDVEVNVTNNAASIGTFDIDDAEVFETIDDVTPDSEYLTYGRGASFDGSTESPGTCTIRLRNYDKKYAPDNASSPLTGLLVLGRQVWVRSTYGGARYANFYGYIRRIVPLPGPRMVEIVCEDPLYKFGRQEVSIPLSFDHSIATFRGDILGELGADFTHRTLAGGIEGNIVYTEADQVSGLGLLSELNKATGTVHFIKPDPSPTIVWKYVTVDRATIQGQAVDETFNETLNDMSGYDLTDEALVNSQRVFPTARVVATEPEVVWEGNVPFDIEAQTIVWAGAGKASVLGGHSNEDISFDDPTFDQTLTIDGTGISSSVFTPFSRSAKIEINTAGGATIDTLFITGRPARRISEVSVIKEDLSVVAERYAGPDIASDFIANTAMAEGLAAWWVYRYKGGAARPDIMLENRFPTQVQRDITDRLSITFGLLGISAKQFLIRSFTTEVTMSALDWTTTYSLESTPTALDLFTVDGTAGQGLGGTGILGY
jgi:hypothetical protein